MQFLDDLKEVWQPEYISSRRRDDIRKEKQKEGILPEEDCFEETDQLPFFGTDYIVIGPLSSDVQVATGEYKIVLRVLYVGKILHSEGTLLL